MTTGFWMMAFGAVASLLGGAAAEFPHDGEVSVAEDGVYYVQFQPDGDVISAQFIGADGTTSEQCANLVYVLNEAGDITASLQFDAAGQVLVADPPEEDPDVQIGVVVEEINAALAAQLDVVANEVVLVTEVIDGLAADQAGLQQYDVVTLIDGTGPVTQERLRAEVQERSPGERLTLSVVRAARPMDLTVEVAPYVQAYDLNAAVTGLYRYDTALDATQARVPVLVEMTATPDQRLYVDDLAVYRNTAVAFDAPLTAYRARVVDRSFPDVIHYDTRIGVNEAVEVECVRTQMRRELESIKQQIANLETLLDQMDD